jgi:hypothetical protein
MFKELMEQIWKASDLETVCHPVGKLFEEIEKMLERKNFSFEEAQETAACLTHVTSLMAELGRIKEGAAHDEKKTAALQELKQRSLDLEGCIKEIRNDLYREKMFKPKTL